MGVATTPPAVYCYDGYQAAGCPIMAAAPSNPVGHLTAVSNGSSQTLYTNFDVMGRVLSHSQMTAGSKYPFSYSYNLAGDLVCEVYPSKRTIVTAYDAANRVAQVAAGSGSAIQYAPQGAAAFYYYGNGLARQTLITTGCR